MKKVDKKTENMIRNRMEWMKGLLKKRKYDMGDKQRRFLVVYYNTIRVLYEDELARKMLLNMNNKFNTPLSDEIVLSDIAKIDTKKGYRYKDETIIEQLGITEDEVLKLEIGKHMREEWELARRKIDDLILRAKIVEMYRSGMRIVDIAEQIDECSKSKIERIVKEEKLDIERKMKRNMKVWELKENGLKESEIVKETGIDRKVVKKILEEKPSNLLITDDKGNKYATPKEQETGNTWIFSLHKKETVVSTIDSFTNALVELKETTRNILIYGSAGTAKSTLLKQYWNSLTIEQKAKTAIVAPTGVAAEHINGRTIHSVFHLPIGVQDTEDITSVPKELLSMDRLIIDEVSMVRYDLYEKVIRIIRYIEQKEHKRIQIICCGDWGQIAPTISKDDKKQLETLYPNYEKPYAFSSPMWEQMNWKYIPLHYVFRQEDSEFRDKLMEVKYGIASALDYFNARSYKNYDPNAICICARNIDVHCYNQKAMEQFDKEDLITYTAKEDYVTPSDMLPCPSVLELCKGVRVMTICNDKHYQNGSLGTVIKTGKYVIEVKLDDGNIVKVRRRKFQLESGAVYEQFPLVLGYAITANKAQGKTFDAVTIVRGQGGFFSAGQLYVALSRCRNADRLCILGKLTLKDLVYDEAALEMTVKKSQDENENRTSPI